MEFVSLPHVPTKGLLGKAKSVEFLRGTGNARGFVVTIIAGGKAGPDRAPTGQLWVPLQGASWIEGEDGVRWRLQPGHAVFIPKGEKHTKGSEEGVVGFLLQVEDMKQLVGRAA